MWTEVRKAEVTGEYRVVCPVHGELARFARFWPASRDARQHDSNCGEELGPDAPDGVAHAPRAE
jgi:hypothetical protein